MKIQILVDSENFWADLQKEILAAKECVLGQTMSFEGDAVGRMFSETIRQSLAKDKRLLLDSYIRAIINDQFLYSFKSRNDAALMAEVRATSELIEENRQAGIQSKFTEPLGLFFYKISMRNHKKLVIIDDRIAYIGGINFCDHNFYWHDMMLRIEEPEIVAYLKHDFEMTWAGKNVGAIKKFDDFTLITLDKRNNENLFQPVFHVIDAAQSHIFVESPYLTFPFIDNLRSAVKRGVKVTICSPDANNWGLMRKYMLWEANRSGFDLQLYQGKMSHLKGMLVDEKTLVVGSTNYDFLSYRAHIENIAIIHDADLVQQFKEKVIAPDIANSRTATEGELQTNGFLAFASMKLLEQISRVLKFFP
ncbi:MAG: phosphatidylserine/phosphatidylglycerophosphate/cardiolipin synthase family protein [Deferribacteres bacterium]|nr:phosphatidylserine/phosphatidylglycerophosphate/cardiolipin synthase family protein [candidate division KSB1 bacterium]MCB9502535.1 phosphatidylserine/phosphatidylglycerophosphate/cardiolipin synthase family protein [Deferribacteres bacterium]